MYNPRHQFKFQKIPTNPWSHVKFHIVFGSGAALSIINQSNFGNHNKQQLSPFSLYLSRVVSFFLLRLALSFSLLLSLNWLLGRVLQNRNVRHCPHSCDAALTADKDRHPVDSRAGEARAPDASPARAAPDWRN